MGENIYLKRLENLPPFARQAACREYRTTRPQMDVMQVNLGKRCNLACKHCHINAGPKRTEKMNRETMEACLRVFENNGFQTLDITGGSPEMNPDFRWLVAEASGRGIHTMVRTNLAILTEDGYTALPAFYAAKRVDLVGSLPYFTEKDTDRQRGSGVFTACIAALKALNALGYGKTPELPLHLVYNPGGAFLPPDQEQMAEQYRKNLSQYGVAFTGLYTITNNPIGRFGDFLERSGNLEGYMDRLVSAFNPGAVENMMCRSQISVDWDGTVYDCDFNLALGLKANVPGKIQELQNTRLGQREIVFGNHCYACTAGAGSSCGGTTA